MPERKTIVSSLYLLLAMIKKAQEMVGIVGWVPKNPEQEWLLEKLAGISSQLSSIGEIKSIASWKAEDINRFLKENGFNIRLEEFGSYEFGAASILDVLLHWIVEGEKKEIFHHLTQKKYPGVRMVIGSRRGTPNAQIFSAPLHSYPIAGIRTKTEDVVFLTIAGNPPQDDVELIKKVGELNRTKNQSSEPYEAIHFPMVDLRQETLIPWLAGLQGMARNNLPAKFLKTMQEVILKMDHKGVQVKMAAVGHLLLKAIDEPHVRKDMIIDRPFFLWIVRPGVEEPVVAAYIEVSDWKEPASFL